MMSQLSSTPKEAIGTLDAADKAGTAYTLRRIEDCSGRCGSATLFADFDDVPGPPLLVHLHADGTWTAAHLGVPAAPAPVEPPALLRLTALKAKIDGMAAEAAARGVDPLIVFYDGNDDDSFDWAVVEQVFSESIDNYVTGPDSTLHEPKGGEEAIVFAAGRNQP
jgi:hypothetical protein